MNYRAKTTICTPTYLMTRQNPQVSSLLGWMLIILFIFAIIMLFVGIFSVLFASGSEVISWNLIKNVVVGLLVALIYVCMVVIFLLDTMSSMESACLEMREIQKRQEEHLYNLYRIMANAHTKK